MLSTSILSEDLTARSLIICVDDVGAALSAMTAFRADLAAKKEIARRVYENYDLRDEGLSTSYTHLVFGGCTIHAEDCRVKDLVDDPSILVGRHCFLDPLTPDQLIEAFFGDNVFSWALRDAAVRVMLSVQAWYNNVDDRDSAWMLVYFEQVKFNTAIAAWTLSPYYDDE